MNKFQFIKELLDTKKFNPQQKERFFKLVSAELSNVGDRDQKILEDIQLIKDKLGMIEGNDIDKSVKYGNPSKFFRMLNFATEINNDDIEFRDDYKPFDVKALIGEEAHNEVMEAADVSLDESVAEIKKDILKKELISTAFATLHNPRKLVKLLNKFSENGNPLKYATHSWEMGQGKGMYVDLEDFLIKLNLAWKEISWSVKELKEELSSKIYAFLLNPNVKENGWGINRIKFGWSSPDLLEEIKKQGLTDPSLIQLPDYARQHLILNKSTATIQRFDQIIQIFKNEIEFRDENLYFENLIIDLHDQYLSPDFNLKEVKGLNKANFYTDVAYFRKAIIKIFGGIKTRPNHSDVSYILEYDNSKYYIFKIIHHNSKADQKSIHDSKFSLEKGDFGDIKESLLNLCDWSIESRFIEGNYRLNFLSSNPETSKTELLENEVEGFIHLLKFYKS